MSTTGPERSQPVSYFQWQSPSLWFGITLGSSIWLAISGVLLLVRGHGVVGAVFLTAFGALAAAAGTAWAQRERRSAYRSWQGWLAMLWIVALVAVATSHVTETYAAINLNAGGLLFLYLGIGIGVPLLMADGYLREKSAGRTGVFGALFDIIASFV
jgi:hypothetical protein